MDNFIKYALDYRKKDVRRYIKGEPTLFLKNENFPFSLAFFFSEQTTMIMIVT